jgi:tRNA dimethylallyltransferase
VHAGIGAFASQNPFETTRFIQRKDDDRQIVIAGKGDGRGIHHAQMLLQDLIIGDGGVAFCIRVFFRVFVIDTVYFGALKDRLTGHFIGAQGRGRVGGEIGVARTCRKNHDTFLFQMPHGAAADIGLADLIHRNGRDDAGKDAQLFQRRLHRQRIHYGGQHSHIVGGRALHPLRTSCKAAKDIAATDDHTNLNPQIAHRFHLGGDALHGGRMQAVTLIAHQRLARDFQHDAGVDGWGVGHGKSYLLGQSVGHERFGIDWPLKCRKTVAGSTGKRPVIKTISREAPVLIAGPTASGKSDLAMALAARDGRIIINADALQVFDMWRVLTARPSEAEESALPHRLYGHIGRDQPYSVGHWLRDVAGLLDQPLVIVGGTGLNFTALTTGLAEIPAIPAAVRARADEVMASGGIAEMLPALDAATRARLDQRNPARVQRAWEVQMATGRGLASWQAETGPPLLALRDCAALVLRPDVPWLDQRIATRFAKMIAQGALDEARAALPYWDARAPWAKAIGAPELIAHLRGQMSLDDSIEAAVLASRQYAKRQRTWLRKGMKDWQTVIPPDLSTGLST